MIISSKKTIILFIIAAIFCSCAAPRQDYTGREAQQGPVIVINPEARLSFGDTNLKAGLTLEAALNYADAFEYFSIQEEKNTALEKLIIALRRLNKAQSEKLPYMIKNPDIRTKIRELLSNIQTDTLTVGCLLPLTGQYQSFGKKALQGIEIAMKTFSSLNPGHKIKLVIEDTESDNETALVKLRQLYDLKHAGCIIGPIGMAETAAVEAQKLAIPIITLTQKEKITETGDYIFRNFFTAEMQINSIVKYAVKEMEMDRFAILYPDEEYGRTYMNIFWDKLIEEGGKIVGLESYDPREMDFGIPIRKLAGVYYNIPYDIKAKIAKQKRKAKYFLGKDKFIYFGSAMPVADYLDRLSPLPSELLPELYPQKASQPEPIVDFEAVFIPDSGKKAGLIIPQLAYYDIDMVQLLGTNLWHSDSLVTMCRKYVQGAIMPEGFFAGSDDYRVRKFTKKFWEIYGTLPEFMEAVSYDTSMILFNIVNSRYVDSRAAIKEKLAELRDFHGVTGITSFNPEGEAEKKLYLLQIRGGDFMEISDPH